MKFNLFPLKKTEYNTPWFVWYISITIIAQFFLINYKEQFQTINPETFILFGAPDTVSIYEGQYWGVFTNNFIHIYWSQLLVNLMGIWLFGAFIERREGVLKLLLLTFTASIIPTLWQLALTASPGIGLSAVNFTLFGYILMKSRIGDAFKLKGRYLILIFMICLLAYLSYYNAFIEDVFKTEAMITGLLLGLLIGFLSDKNKWVRFSILSFLFTISVSSLFYAPWSPEWLVYKGVRAHESKNYKRAIIYYKQALKMDKENEQAQENLDLLEIDKLKAKAYKEHIAKNYDKARKIYLQILEIEPEDEWTLTNLKELP
jgi:membrane associated rhomboid family serine protease